jgi:hypothetical protein
LAEQQADPADGRKNAPRSIARAHSH